MAIKFDMSSLEKGLEALENKSEIAVKMLAETGAVKMQGYAQGHAPWTDRTGRARQTLKGSVETISNGYKIKIAHGVDYGIWLELAHEKRFAIIPNTLNYGEQTILPAFYKLLERI